MAAWARYLAVVAALRTSFLYNNENSQRQSRNLNQTTRKEDRAILECDERFQICWSVTERQSCQLSWIGTASV